MLLLFFFTDNHLLAYSLLLFIIISRRSEVPQTTTTTPLGVDRIEKISVAFHKRRLIEDQDLFVREGDFIQYGENFYEILTLQEPKWLFGQVE